MFDGVFYDLCKWHLNDIGSESVINSAQHYAAGAM